VASGAVNREKLENSLGVRVAGDLLVGHRAKDDGLGLIKPAVQVEDTISYLAPKDFLHLVLAQPGHGL
jgi:hypothetical protein